MANRIEWKCDGCDEVVFSDHDLPAPWAHVEIKLDGDPNLRLLEWFDLCPACRLKLGGMADPRKWARPLRPA